MIPEFELIGLERELVDELRTIWNDDDFVLGIRACLKNDDERQNVLSAIRSGEITDSDDISLYAIDIYNDRQGSENLSRTA